MPWKASSSGPPLRRPSAPVRNSCARPSCPIHSPVEELSITPPVLGERRRPAPTGHRTSLCEAPGSRFAYSKAAMKEVVRSRTAVLVTYHDDRPALEACQSRPADRAISRRLGFANGSLSLLPVLDVCNVHASRVACVRPPLPTLRVGI